ncbi:MAG: hypothetical protein WCA07_05470 [Gloeobacterales cyanobacterium]
MAKTNFITRLQAAVEAHQEEFGYPYVSLKVLQAELDMESQAFQADLAKALKAAQIRMTPLPEPVQAALPTNAAPVVIDGQAYVSLAIN